LLIDYGVFFGCSGLISVSIRSNITSIESRAFFNCSNLTSITIPSSVVSIGSEAFNGCSSLESVNYLGLNDPNETQSSGSIFQGCDQLRFVCLPLDYNSTSFCGIEEFCKHEACGSFLGNHCFEPICSDGIISERMRENATAWESKSNGCYEFQCLKDRGAVYWKQCKETEEVCENDRCITAESANEEDVFKVEIDVSGINVANLNMSEIQNAISILTDIETDSIRIRAEVNDRDIVVHIIVIVDDEQSAKIISKSINDLDPEKTEGVLKHFKGAHVEERKFDKSIGITTEQKSTVIKIALLFFMFSYVL